MDKTSPFQGEILYFRRLSSSQEYLCEQIKQQYLPEGTVVWAAYQTNGYGKGSHRWLSKQGQNLTFSCLLRPEFLPVQDGFSLTQSMALGIADFLLPFLSDVKIKWPNDIWVGNRKICGFISDSQCVGGYFQTVVFGIGLNINQKSFSGEAVQGTSLAMETGNTYNLEEALLNLLKCLSIRYHQLKSGETEKINNDYHNLLFLRNIPHTFSYRNKPIVATILGVNSFGWLLLEDKDKKTLTCDMEEIKLLP